MYGLDSLITKMSKSKLPVENRCQIVYGVLSEYDKERLLMYSKVKEFEMEWVIQNPELYKTEMEDLQKKYGKDVKITTYGTKITFEAKRNFGKYVGNYDCYHGNVVIYVDNNNSYTMVVNDDHIKTGLTSDTVITIMFFHKTHKKNAVDVIQKLISFL